MKSVREILIARHREMEPKLDSVRQDVVKGLEVKATEMTAPARVIATHPSFWQRLNVSVRWHLTALSATWALIAVLAHDPSTATGTNSPKRQAPPPRMLLLTLLENRRQLLDLSSTPLRDSTRPPDKRGPAPRSDVKRTTSAV